MQPRVVMKIRRERTAMSVVKDKILVLQPAMASYRREFLVTLEELAFEGRFLVGDRHFVDTVKTGVDSHLIERTGQNRFILGSRFGWQRGVWSRSVSAETCMVELNPRNLNTWFVLLVRRALGRRTWVWGHAWPRAGQGSRSDSVRGLLRSLSGRVMVYTSADATSLAAKSPGLMVRVAPNSLYRESDLIYPGDMASHHFLWVGRMVAEKKPELAIDAVAVIVASGADVSLVFVGDGPERKRLEEMVAQKGLSSNIRFEGWLDDRDRLCELFGKAYALVCSGYVGLNVTQSLGFGCPVIYPDKEPHAPEVVLLDEGNSVQFSAGQAKDLAAQMLASRSRTFDRRGISESTRSEYSADRMAGNFRDALALQ